MLERLLLLEAREPFFIFFLLPPFTHSRSPLRLFSSPPFSALFLLHLPPASFLPACGFCPASGRGRFPASDRMAARRAVPVATKEATGIDSRDAAGDERSGPLHTTYKTPYTPLFAWRRGALSSAVYLVRRSPQGAVGTHLPASQAICAPAAALPLRGDRLCAPARWDTRIFPGIRVVRPGGTSAGKFSHA